MCGICGIVNFEQRAVSLESLKRMNEAHIFRGPDDEGTLIKDNAGLGFRRLSIIDLRTGGQPIHNENEQIWVICNGEIYNFLELREELQNKAHHFYTKSDAETIVHLYEEFGDDFLDKVEGMFAIAVWDNHRHRLVLARDRMGEKPLYYAVLSDKLIFASEIKAMLCNPDINRTLDIEAVSKYFSYEFIPAPKTPFTQIKKLLPGHILTLDKKQVSIKRYWDMKFSSNEVSSICEEEVAQQLDVLLKESVRKRLISDVALGAFLSGGIDSSYIVSLMTDICPGKVKTFTIAFEDASFDESRYAREVAGYLKTQHFEETLTSRQLMDLIPGICDFLDEPLGDASIVPTYLLSCFAKKYVTVALSGDGADELFAGYPTYSAHVLAQYYLKMPAPLRNGLNFLAEKMPVSLDNFSLDFKIKKFISGLEYKPEMRHYNWLGSFSPRQKEELFCEEFKQHLCSARALEDSIEFHLGNCDSKKPLERLLYLDAKLYLQDDILVKVDRASMANALEVRSPFLGEKFVEFAVKLPLHFKLNKFKSKFILKKAAEKRLPKKIVNRPKKGFGIPVAKWIKGDLKQFVLDKFNYSKIEKQQIFNYTYIEQLLNEHFSGKKDNRKPIWTLLIFQMWYEKYISRIY